MISLPLSSSVLLAAVSLSTMWPVSAPEPTSLPTSLSNGPVCHDKELLIKSIDIVDHPDLVDPGMPLHFGTIFSSLAGSLSVPGFARDWLTTWFSVQTVNKDRVFHPDQVASIQGLIDDWETEAGGIGSELDPDFAPFRLLAIVNRPDLARTVDGQIETAGELRLVYSRWSVLGGQGVSSGEGLDELFIFEFDVPATSCEEVKAWHQAWQMLGNLELDSAAFRSQLTWMVQEVVDPDPSNGRPNGSNLAQLRTNLFAEGCLTCDTNHWELREFNIAPVLGAIGLGPLIPVTTKQTPDLGYLRWANFNPNLPHRGSRQVLEDWLDANAVDIRAGIHVVPERFPLIDSALINAWKLADHDEYVAENGEVGLLGGQAINDQNETAQFPPGGFGAARWWTPKYQPSNAANLTGKDSDTRHKFAIQTCVGCHGGETGTGGTGRFQMMTPREVGEETSLAPFITGLTVPDLIFPNDSSMNRSFNDLRVREAAYLQILGMNCSSESSGNGGLATMEAIQARRGSRPH